MFSGSANGPELERQLNSEAQQPMKLSGGRRAQRTATGASDVAYQPIPTEDKHKEHHAWKSKNLEEGNCGVQFLDDLRLQNIIGLVIICNGAVIGLETDFPDLADWAIIEKGFLVFFICELLLKVCVERCQFFDSGHPDFLWNGFDTMVIGIGVADTTLELLGKKQCMGFATLFRMIRLLRIMRLFRLLKFMKRLYVLAMGLVEASKAVFWVTILMGFLMYLCGIVLVKTVGRTVPSDPHYDFLQERFADIPKAMITLFVLISSPNLPIYQDETGLLESRPFFTLFLIFFITFGCFGLLGMLTGVINETMFDNNEMRKEEKRVLHEEMRMVFAQQCAVLFEDVPKSVDGEASIEDVKQLAPQLLVSLAGAGSNIAHGDICKFINQIDVDDSGTINIFEFVEAMESVAEGLTPLATLSVQRAVGQCIRTLEQVEKHIHTVDDRVIKVEEKLFIELRHLHESNKVVRDEHSTTRSSVESSVAACTDGHMRRLFDQFELQKSGLQVGLVEQIGGMQKELAKSIQILATQMDGSHNYVQTVVNQQTLDLRRSMQALSDQKEADRETFCTALSQQMRDTLKVMQKGEGELGELFLKVSDKTDCSVMKQMGEMKTSVRQLLDQKQDAAEVLLSTVSKQIMDLQKSVTSSVEQKGSTETSEQFEGTNQAVQKLLEQWRVIGNEASLHGVISRNTEQIHKSVQKFLDQKDSNESRLHLAVSSQIHDIATAVQKLLHERDCRETSRDGNDPLQQQAVSQQISEIRDSVEILRHSKGGADESLELVVSQQMQDMKLSVQRQMDTTRTNLLEGVAELGGVVLGGVADLLAKNKLAIHQECSDMLQSTIQSQEQALQSFLRTSWQHRQS